MRLLVLLVSGLLSGLVSLGAPFGLAAAAAGASAAVWPLVPRPEVVAAFDPPDSPWGSGHRGVDLLGSPGERVRAAAAGRVTYAAVLAGRGVVVVDHGAERTTYEPVAASVHVGDPVREGQVLGTLELGMSHCFPRACLHWGLLRGDTYLDPLTLVGAGPLRLMPLAGEPARAGPGAPTGPALHGVAPDGVDPLAALRPWGVPVGRPPGDARW